MLVKPKQSQKWRRRGRPGHGAPRPSPSVESRTSIPSARERRHAGPSEDRALYSCECGCVFEAPVTTSVGCPHCGTAQAW
jgi:hypothetical protein